MARRFEQQYRIASNDEVMTKENAIHLDLDLRLDVLEVKSDADKSAAEVIARGVAIIEGTLVPQATEIEELLDGYRQGVPAAKVAETAERRFLSDAEIADLRSRLTADQVQEIADTSAAAAAEVAKVDLIGGAAPARNTLKKVSDAIDVLTAGAPALLDTFLEVAAKLTSDDDQLAAVMIALANRLRVDAGQGLTAAQQAQAIANLGLNTKLPDGQVRLQLVNGAQLALMPVGGGSIVVNNTPVQIPAGGITLAPSGAAFPNYYFVYLYLDGSTPKLLASGAQPVTDQVGRRVMSGDATKRLVGMYALLGDGSFNDRANGRFVLSFFNRVNKQMAWSFDASTSSSSRTPVDQGHVIITWDDEPVVLNTSCEAIKTGDDTGTPYMSIAIGVDGNEPGGISTGTANVPTRYQGSFIAARHGGAPMGLGSHTITTRVSTSSSTGRFVGTQEVVVRG